MEWLLFFTCLILSIVGWLNVLTSTGAIVQMDEAGFVIQSRLRTLHSVLWSDLKGPAYLINQQVPRQVMFARRTKTLLTFHSGYRIIREPSELDDRFMTEVERRLGTQSWD